jgi:hypothetical protein
MIAARRRNGMSRTSTRSIAREKAVEDILPPRQTDPLQPTATRVARALGLPEPA